MTASLTVVDLGARRRQGEAAIAATAAAPVLHVTTAFLDALNCRDVLAGATGQPVRALRAVSAG